MTIPIPDKFNDPQGRFHDGAASPTTLWDSTMPFHADTTWLDELEHKHVDLRGFFGTSQTLPRTQGELDLLIQSTIEEDTGVYGDQAGIEASILAAGENWSKTGTGFTEPIVGLMSDKKNWRGLRMMTRGNVIDDILTSGIAVDPTNAATDPVDISGTFDHLSIPMMGLDVSFFDADSYVQLTSNPTGVFGTATYDSAQVAFSADAGGTNELRLALGDFTTGAGATFSLAEVTGIRIHFRKDAGTTADQRLTIFSIRAITTQWTYRQQDIDTRRGVLYLPPTQGGAEPSTGVQIPLIRGNGTSEDPKPLDGSVLAYFGTGHTGYFKDTFTTLSSKWKNSTKFTGMDSFSHLTISNGRLAWSQVGPENYYEITNSEWQVFGGDMQYTAKVTAGAQGDGSGDNFGFGFTLKIASTDHDYIDAYIVDDGVNTRLRCGIDVTGFGYASNNLVIPRITPGQTFWIRAKLVNDTVTCEYHATEPSPTATPTYSVSQTINEATINFPSNDAYANIRMENDAESTMFIWPRNTSTFVDDVIAEPVPISDATHNSIDLYFRERKDTVASTGSWIRTTLKWNHKETLIVVAKESYASGVTTVQYTETVNLNMVLETLNALDSGIGRYLLRGNIVGTTLTVDLYDTDAANNIGSNLFTHTFKNEALEVIGGRVGINTSFIHRDAFIDELSAASTGFATLRTKTFPSRTPVDGAQLTASFSVDENLFRDFRWIDPAEEYIDQTKTLSGRGSFRTSKGYYTNSVLIEDWNHTYVSMNVWVGQNVTDTNQPALYLRSGAGEVEVLLPTLQPNQWNAVHVDLSTLIDEQTGLFYTFVVQPKDYDTALGYFWIDNMKIGRRLVDWQVRATENGVWRSFFGAVNQPDAGLHLPGTERGTELQLQAVALTPEAWVASYTLKPRYAQLGLPVYDVAYET